MPRRRDAEGTRRTLLDEGVAAFTRDGFHGTGLKGLLDGAGIPKGSFYNYFASKEAFGAAVIDHYADCVARGLATALEASDDPAVGLRVFFETERNAFVASDFVGGCLVANLAGEVEASEPLRDALSRAFARYVGGVRTTIEAAQEFGTIRSDVPAERLAHMLVDGWEGAVLRMKIERSPAPLTECLDTLLGDWFRA